MVAPDGVSGMDLLIPLIKPLWKVRWTLDSLQSLC